MRDDQNQLFKMEYGTRCDTFGCGEAGAYFVGRPDGPLNTSHILCQTCTDELVESVGVLFNATPDVLTTIPDVAVEGEYAWTFAERLLEVKTHAGLDEIIAEFKLTGIPDRENAKLQERKNLIALAVS